MRTNTTQPRSYRSRLLRKLALCLALGVVSTVALSWYAGIDRYTPWFLSGEVRDWSYVSSMTPKTRFSLRSNWCRTEVRTYRHEHDLLPALRPGRGRFFSTPPSVLQAPTWSIASQLETDSTGRGFSGRVEDVAYGWPFRAMRSRLTILNSDKETLYFAFHLGPRFDGVIVAYKPIPLGFAANTLIFAAAFAIPLIALPALRRQFRARRSHCPSWNYDLRGLPSPTCPECGRTSS